jgi:hypothetical protein
MIQMGLELDGSKAAVDRIRAFRRTHELAYRAAVYLFAQEVTGTAQRLCPVDTGFLRKSRYVSRPTIDGDHFESEIGFDAPYALFVHERNLRYVVGEWKFLQRAIAHHAPTALDRIAALTAAGAKSGLTPDNVPAIHPTEPPGGTRPKVKHSKATRAKRAAARERNEGRIQREAFAERKALAEGKRPPRPGRG